MKALRVSRTAQVLAALVAAAVAAIGVSLSVQAASAPVPADLLADYDTSPG